MPCKHILVQFNSTKSRLSRVRQFIHQGGVFVHRHTELCLKQRVGWLPRNVIPPLLGGLAIRSLYVELGSPCLSRVKWTPATNYFMLAIYRGYNPWHEPWTIGWFIAIPYKWGYHKLDSKAGGSLLIPHVQQLARILWTKNIFSGLVCPPKLPKSTSWNLGRHSIGCWTILPCSPSNELGRGDVFLIVATWLCRKV